MSEVKYFTYLWTNAAWKRKTELAREGFGAIEYAASKKFSSAGVEPGSVVFLVTNIKGSLFLGGTVEVHQILNHRDAAAYLKIRPADLWSAKEFIVAPHGREDYFRGDLKVDDRIAHGLKYRKRSGGFQHPKLDREGKIDRQTLRNVRCLYPGAEQPLLELLSLR